MRLSVTCLCTILLLLTARIVHAQYIFSNLYPRDGLSSKEVFCSYTDKDGFLWCGTFNGLNRWDGSRFYVITPYSKTYPGLVNESVYSILEWNRKLWVGTARGLSALNKNVGRFYTIPFVRGNDTVVEPEILRLSTEDNQHLWASTNKGLFVYDRGCMRPISTLFNVPKKLDSIACLLAPAGGAAMWVASGNLLYYLDTKKDLSYSKSYNPLHWDIFERNWISAMNVDSRGFTWYSTYYKNGLFRFDRATGTTTVIPGLDSQAILTLHNDSQERLWISTTTPHLLVLDHKTSRLKQLPGGDGSISYPFVYNAHEDALGNLWFATANGISKLSVVQPLETYIDLPMKLTRAGTPFSLVNAIQVADTGHIWVCKDDGVYSMNLTDYSFRRYSPSDELEARESRIFDIQNIKGRWWCGTGTGIHFLDSATGKFTPFTAYPEERTTPWKKSVMWIREDKDGNIWYASWIDAVYRYNPKTGKSVRINEEDPKDFHKINCLLGFSDSRGRFWIGYGNKGIRQWDAASNRLINPIAAGADREAFSNVIVYNMVEDMHGGYWLSTDRMGAVQLDSNGHILNRISLQNGLNTTSALFVWMQPGGNRLWIATSEGIQTYEISRKLLSAIDMDFGLLTKDYCSVILGIKDKAYVSFNAKLAVVNLNAAPAAVITPLPLIAGVRVFEAERPVPYGDSLLRLEHNENFFTIDFSSPLHHEVLALQYAYMLEGYDKDWVYCGRRQFAAYTNVPPGNYRFLVRTTNQRGDWQQGASKMKISIHAAFWQRTWFTVFLLLLLALGVWYLAQYIYHRRRRQRIAATIDYFAKSNYGDNSVTDICWDISRNCIAQMNLEDCVIYLKNPERPVLHQVAAYGPKNPHGHIIDNQIDIKIGEGIVGAVAATGKPILVADTRKDARYLVDDAQRLSELAVPILHDGEVIGVIDTEHSRKGFYKEVHVKALSTIASICANKIAEAQAEASVRENEKELLQIRSMLADSQLMALRTQMNPHFVFNSLNSIQECIVTGKYGEASNYLNKFSKLFRALLENSSKPLIPLAEEIAVLELYLSLEHMRFEGSFDYKISVDEELEAEEIMIPSMLLQPFVENALWHGLMHKDGERRLNISFEAIDGDLFRCTVDDNGIGREKAAALKSSRNSGKSHISRGLQITTDRINLMHRRGQAASLRIIDKRNTAGQPAGTTVVVELSAYLTTLEV